MNNILENIVKERKRTIKKLKRIISEEQWEMLPLFQKKCISLKKALLKKNTAGIIAEFKRASPSKGIINANVDVFDVVLDYQMNGAAGISILTEPVFFEGNNDDILTLAGSLTIPVLRKDFIVDEYQIVETKALGADVVLLIAAVLTKLETQRFTKLAHELGMEVILEIHNEMESEWISDEIDIVGVNNRDLKTFTVDINRSVELSERIPGNKIRISESGIDDIATIRLLQQHGFNGFLMGDKFMKEKNPGKAFKNFTEKLKEAE
jgi:indole-3-glycerol phosphate synthase